MANDVARNAIRELDAFSHTVAHDLHSPLNAMIGFAELLVDHVQDAKLRTFADLPSRVRSPMLQPRTAPALAARLTASRSPEIRVSRRA